MLAQSNLSQSLIVMNETLLPAEMLVQMLPTKLSYPLWQIKH